MVSCVLFVLLLWVFVFGVEDQEGVGKESISWFMTIPVIFLHTHLHKHTWVVRVIRYVMVGHWSWKYILVDIGLMGILWGGILCLWIFFNLTLCMNPIFDGYTFTMCDYFFFSGKHKNKKLLPVVYKGFWLILTENRGFSERTIKQVINALDQTRERFIRVATRPTADRERALCASWNACAGRQRYSMTIRYTFESESS